MKNIWVKSPLFYDNMDEASNIISDLDLIKKEVNT